MNNTTTRSKLRSPPTTTSSSILVGNANPHYKMPPPRKSLLNPTLALASFLFFALFALYFTYLSFSSNSNPNCNSSSPLGSLGRRNDAVDPRRPVKIYMYDLPRKFTYGVIESYAKARAGVGAGGGGGGGGTAADGGQSDDASLKYPGNQHSAEWYLFRDLNRPSEERFGSAVARVYDPEEADLFYVPFFSSVSLVVNMNRPGTVGDPVSYSDEEMQESLLVWLEKQPYWKRNNGWDHVFVCQDPNALYKIVDRVKNAVLLVSDFGRLTHDQGSLVKDVILPYSHRINPYSGEIGVENRDKLLFFMGNRYRKEGGKVRDLLFQLLENEKDVIIKHGAQSRESRREATRGMHTSKFCLHPAGDTPSACRLFDAIVSLCIPVVVSDYVELPFEDVIDYRKIAIFVDTNTGVKPRYLVNLLRKVSTEQLLEFQKNLNKVKHYFEYEDPNGTVKEIWRQVSQKLPLIKLMVNRDKRLVTREVKEPDCSCLCSNQSGIHTTR